MGDVFLPIQIEYDEKLKTNVFFVMLREKKRLNGQIMIYKENGNGGYVPLGSLSQNPNIKDDFITDTYFVKTEDVRLLLGGNKTKRRQYHYRSSSKKRIASRRRNVSRRSRGRQTKYSRRK
jgi:hypothetical protein